MSELRVIQTLCVFIMYAAYSLRMMPRRNQVVMFVGDFSGNVLGELERFLRMTHKSTQIEPCVGKESIRAFDCAQAVNSFGTS